MEKDEEIRKIQFTGKSSYIVSLPKEWVSDLGLKQGDQVTVTRQGTSSLQIIPSKQNKKRGYSEEASFEITEEEKDSSIIRKLISLYLLGFTIIHVKPRKGRLTPSQRIAIKTTAKKILMGSEIIADSSDGVTIQVLINLLELSIDGAFKRMLLIAKSMQNDALIAVRELNPEIAKEVINTDDEVDRFGFYIIRQLKIAVQNEHMLKDMGLDNTINCLGYRVVVKNIERLGDHAVSLAKDVLEYNKPIRKQILDRVQDMNDFALSAIDNASLAMFKKDFNQAEIAIQKANEVTKHEKKVLDLLKGLDDDEEIYRTRRIIENIRRIAEYASDIGEIVLNMTVEKVLVRKR